MLLRTQGAVQSGFYAKRCFRTIQELFYDLLVSIMAYSWLMRALYLF